MTALKWLILPLISLWPVGIWMVARMFDGSDDPYGIIALIALMLLLLRTRNHFTEHPQGYWLGCALLFMCLGTLSLLPWLVRGFCAVIAMMSMIRACSPHNPFLALWGLGFLALPIMSSLQFFIGYPLRVLTAEASVIILDVFGITAARSGSSLEINGFLIMVDAPCSGIQMAWAAYFTACLAGAWFHMSNRAFLRKLPLVSLIIISGNIIRNTLLVLKEAHYIALPEWSHSAIGLCIFMIMNGMILWIFTRNQTMSKIIYAHNRSTFTPSFNNTTLSNHNASILRVPLFSQRILYSSLLTISLILSLIPWLVPQANARAGEKTFVEWPQMLGGKPVRPLTLSAIEMRFAENFPGTITRLTDEMDIYILRNVEQATRKLHPATDCFAGLGYTIANIKLMQLNLIAPNKSGALARCFTAHKAETTLEVCEQIFDDSEQSYSDTSAWYWQAALGKTEGPWQAITRITRI